MGRPQFAQPGTSGGGQTVAVTDRPELDTLNVDQSGSLASGATETVDVFAPTGSVYELQAAQMKVNPDGTATSGTHQLQVRPMGASIPLIYGKSGYTTAVSWWRGYWESAGQTAAPPDDAAAVMNLQQAKATENAPFQLSYTNNTDAAQDNDRIYRLFVREDSY